MSEMKKVNDAEIEKILKNERFESSMLITTTCMDAGLNLKDPDIRYIIVDVQDVGSIIQCIGRKRIGKEEDPVCVYIKENNEYKENL